MAIRFPKATLKILNETGFSSKLLNRGRRLIDKDGEFNIIRKGSSRLDAYYYIFELSWPKFLLGIVILFLIINVLFAIAFFLIGVDQLEGISSNTSHAEQLAQCIFFSIQTFTTVGYGTIHPVGLGANILSSLLSFIGFFTFSIFTGISLARFAKPQSKILFSNVALVNKEESNNQLQFRIVNSRPNKLFSVEATVVMTCVQSTKGQDKRHFSALKLEYEKIIMLPIDWTITHTIDDSSPLHGLTKETLDEMEAEFLVSIKAYDDAYNQDVHSNYSYLFNEIIWGAKFKLMYRNVNNSTVLDLNMLSQYEKN